MKKKKQSKADFLRSWHIFDRSLIQSGFTWLRYKNPPEKGIYWYYFSLMVRKRDVENWGTCISCGRAITMDTCDAGHFMPARDCGRDLLFDPLNVNAECKGCNGFDETHLLGYAENLDIRYGIGTAKSLRERRDAYRLGGIVKDFSKEVYAQFIRELPTYQQVVVASFETDIKMARIRT